MRNFEAKSIKSYNEKADDYDNTFDGKFTVKFKHYLLEKIKLTVGDAVLDIACGNGTLLNMLSSKYNIIGKGVDISEKMIANARMKAPQMMFEVAGCESIPFDDETIDIITVCAAYHHFPNVRLFAKEAHRLLKENGTIYIADVYYSTIIRWIINPFVPLSKAGDVRFYSPNEIIKNFEAFGFEAINISINGHVQIVSLRKV